METAIRIFRDNYCTLRIDILILAVIIICLIPYGSYGQEQVKTKNAISIEGASFVLIGNYNINYEVAVLSTANYNLNLSAGFGGWYLFPVSRIYYGKSIPVAFNNVFGSGNHHFEVTAGARYTFIKVRNVQTLPLPEEQEVPKVWPIINVGYRYQNPTGKGLMFRVFAGISGIGVGVGKAF
jgi:hypothetical protein